MWRSVCLRILFCSFFLLQPCQPCKPKRQATPVLQHPRPTTTSESCQNISTDAYPPIITKVSEACPDHKIIDHHSCKNTDMCLRIQTGNVTDYSRLFYSSRPQANRMILHGYLICGGDGISVTGKTSAFHEFYMTFISPKPRKNSRFFVNKSGQSSPILLQNTLNSFDDTGDDNEIDEMRQFKEGSVDLGSADFDSRYPQLPKSGYILDIVAFYDNAFKMGCNEKGIDPTEIIEMIFNYVNEFFKDESLGTKVLIRLKSSIFKQGVNWNNAQTNGTEASLKTLRFYDNMYAYLGVLSLSDTIFGKVPDIGKCLNSKCSGVCSEHRYQRTFVAECDLDNLHAAAWVIYVDSDPIQRSKYSLKSMPCTGIMGIINYNNMNNLKWSECSTEYLRIYHENTQKILPKFCLKPYVHVKHVEAIDGGSLDLTCDMRKCNNVLYVNWYSKTSSPIGYHSPMFGDTVVEKNYSGSIRKIKAEDGQVTLEIKKYSNNLAGIYCQVQTVDADVYCEKIQKFEPDPCRSIICNVSGETCDNGACKCGSSSTCEGLTTGSYCDAGNSTCKCSENLESCLGKTTGEYCDAANDVCKCSKNLNSCEGNSSGAFCDAAHNVCKCTSTLKSCYGKSTGDYCDATNNICKCTSTLDSCAGKYTGQYCDSQANNGRGKCKCSKDIECNVAGELCVNGQCKCGSSNSCAAKPTGEYCDATLSICKCTSSLDSCAGEITGQYCDATNDLCKCTASLESCAGKTTGEYCDSLNNVCKCTATLESCAGKTTGEYCDASKNNGSGECKCSITVPACREPTPVCEKGFCVPDDKLIIIGGSPDYQKYLSNVELITPSSNNDDCDPTDLNEEVAYHASVLSPDGNIVTCGGRDKNFNLLSNCQIQTSTGETRSFPSMIDKRSLFGMSIIDGTVYAIGGYPPHNKMESINIKTGDQWKEEANMPFSVFRHCVVTINTKIVVIGGRALDTMWIYDTIHKNWTRGPSLNVKRWSHACLVDKKTSTIHVMGGFDHTDYRLSSTEKLKFNDVNRKWEMASNLLGALAESAAVSSRSNEFVGYLVGGELKYGRRISEIWGLRRSNQQWIDTSKRLKIARDDHTVVNVYDSQIPYC